MAWWNPASWGDESDSQKQQRTDLGNQGGMASEFGDIGQRNYGQGSADVDAAAEALRRRASGQDSLSAEQLRQGIQQQYAAQRSMAASASPANAAMAARNAAMNMGRAQTGMAGQTAMAGIAERQSAQDALARMLLEKRQQDAQVALQSRQNAISGYGGMKPEGSLLDKWGGAVSAGLGAAAAAKGK